MYKLRLWVFGMNLGRRSEGFCRNFCVTLHAVWVIAALPYNGGLPKLRED
jgi:hypothetical protein